MRLLRRFVDDHRGGALVALHDLDLPARLVWMRDGRIVADGAPEETLTPERLANVPQVRAEVR